MYDLREDPGEMRNLYEDPSGAVMRKQALDMIKARPGPVLKERLPVVGMA